MAYTREFLRKAAKESGIELPKELEDALVAEHLAARDAFVETKIKPLQEIIDNHKEINVEESEVYKTLKKQFDDYKIDVENNASNSKKLESLKSSLKEAGANESFIERMVKGFDLSTVDLEKGLDDVVNGFKTGEWADVFGSTSKQPKETHTHTKPQSQVLFTKEQIEAMSPEEINSNWDKIATQLDKLK